MLALKNENIEFYMFWSKFQNGSNRLKNGLFSKKRAEQAL
jgi:hypothetical protein